MARIYLDRKGTYWIAEWVDNVGRVVKRKLIRAARLENKNDLFDMAAHVAQVHINRYRRLLAEKQAASYETILDMAERSSFPREVVAREIVSICMSIGRGNAFTSNAESIYESGFALLCYRLENRPGASGNVRYSEIYKILNDETRISVSIDIVDKICTEFDCVLSDFVDSSLDWAEKRGEWAYRKGDPDPWPFGYVTDEALAE